MKILCIGGGPAGLYFGLLMKLRHPAHHITVVERNKPYDTFGWGVVFSDATMDNMRQWDRQSADEIQKAFNHWDDIELEFKGEVIRSGGHGFVGIGRKKLLNILQTRCEALGVKLVFETDADSDADYPDADLIIASDVLYERDQPETLSRFIDLHSSPAVDIIVLDPDRGNRNGFCRRMVGLGYVLDLQRAGTRQSTGEAYKGHFLNFSRSQAPP